MTILNNINLFYTYSIIILILDLNVQFIFNFSKISDISAYILSKYFSDIAYFVKSLFYY